MSRTGGVLRSRGDRVTTGARGPETRSEMKRYMMLVNFDGGTVEEPMDEWKPEEIEAHMDYYGALNGAPRDRRAGGRAGPGRAGSGQDRDGRRLTAPSSPTGPFPEIKELLAGYLIVDVESEERAIEIAARSRRCPARAASARAADPGPPGDGRAERRVT